MCQSPQSDHQDRGLPRQPGRHQDAHQGGGEADPGINGVSRGGCDAGSSEGHILLISQTQSKHYAGIRSRARRKVPGSIPGASNTFDNVQS